MASPFPGMDPYLEDPELWPDVHHGLIEAIRDSLAPRIRPKYRVAIEKRVYLAEPEGLVFVGRPDVSVLRDRPPIAGEVPEAAALRSSEAPLTVTLPMPDIVEEASLLIREVPGGQIVTALEVLSPANKRAGEGRRVYEIKRQQVLGSSTHLVELDLLRAGDPMPILEIEERSAYRILVSRAWERPRAKLYRFGLQDPLPPFPVPLAAGDPEPQVDLKALLDDLYERAGYDLAVNYGSEPAERLSAGDSAWAAALLRGKGLRG
jgi:hypothetical protein